MDLGLEIQAADAPGGLIRLTDWDIAPRRVRVVRKLIEGPVGTVVRFLSLDHNVLDVLERRAVRGPPLGWADVRF
jgi:hypothetical protein